MKKFKVIVLALIMIFCLLLSACGSDAPAAQEEKAQSVEAGAPAETVKEAEPEPEPEPEPEVLEETDYIGFAWDCIDDGNYHDALAAVVLWAEEGIAEEDQSEYEELLDVIAANTGKDEPKSGTELERTFIYQGGGLLTLKAESGPVEVTVIDVNDDSQYVRFYVRSGETAEINLPASVYDISYKIGVVWFDADIGFGDIYYEGCYDEPFDFSSTSDYAWITNIHWEVTI